MFDNIIKKIEKKRIIPRYLLLILFLFIAAINFNLFIYPNKIVAGGVNGLSIIIERTLSISPANFILFFSIISLIISAILLGVSKTSSALLATFLYPVFVNITSNIGTIINFREADMLLVCLFAGIISGWTSGMVYKIGLSNGSLTLVTQIIYEKFKISVSKSSFVINTIILAIGGCYFGIENVMYGIIILYINSFVMDRVILGISSNKHFYIVTSKEKEVKKYVISELKNGVTEFKTKGGYEGKDKKLIMTVVSTRDYIKLTEGIKDIDSDAFFVVTDSYQTKGGS